MQEFQGHGSRSRVLAENRLELPMPPFKSRKVLRQVWPLGQKNQHHLGICQKCTFQAPTQTHRIRNPGGGPSNLHTSRHPPPGDPDSAQVWEAWLSGLMATTSPQPDPRSHSPPHAQGSMLWPLAEPESSSLPLLFAFIPLLGLDSSNPSSGT